MSKNETLPVSHKLLRADLLAALARELEIQCHYPEGESWKLWVNRSAWLWISREWPARLWTKCS